VKLITQRVLAVLVMVCVSACVAGAAPQEQDVTATLEALQQKIRDQDRRIAELEARTDE
jgi:hypothetical protein